MPGGFNLSAIKAYLSKAWGLGPSRADGVLLLGTTMEPAKRLGSEADARTWLDTVVALYAQRAGVSLSSGGTSGGAGGGGGGAVINSEEFLKFQADQERFAAQQVELYMRYLGRDSRAGEIKFDAEKANSAVLQSRLDAIAKEHGDSYIDGIQPVFDSLKARHFDSSWNWVRQDALLMFYDIIFGRLTTVDREITARCIAIMNRAILSCLGSTAPYKDVTFPTAPHTEVTAKGDIVYTEIVRENVRKLEAYVEEMASGDTITAPTNIQKIQDDVLKLWNVVKSQPEISEEQKNRIKALYEGVVRSLRKRPESRPRPGAPRQRRSSSQFLRPQVSSVTSITADKVPLLHLKRKVGTNWEYSSNLTGVYLDILHEIATSGTTFKDKNALLTGVGKGSIGVEILKGLSLGSKGSALTVVPFNQGSKQDVEALVDYIYSILGLDLDYILPFAAVPENGREIDGLDDKSELAHRIMLVNLLRLLGAVKIKKASRHFTLFNRWNSESWGEYLCLAGAVIGWTRGTGLMDATNMVAHDVESHGVRTFSAKEMAFNILGLMHPLLFSITQVEPIWADLNGGMDRLPDLAEITTRIRSNLNKKSELRRAIARDNAADFKIVNGVEAERVLQTVNVTPRANFKFDFPALGSIESLSDVSQLRGMLDLEKVIVVTGFAEHFDGRLKDGRKGRYEKDILTHAGVRLIEPELFRGYDPKKKVFNQEIELLHDLEPFEVAEVEAEKFKYEHGDKCDIWAGEGGQWFVKFKKGSRVLVPKAFKFNRLVGGQIPTGWSAGRYGIPADIIAQTDRTSLWALASAAEALNMSGITDPYELYQHMHPSEVGSSIGSGMGGMESLSQMFKDRRDEKEVQNDILQETFINTTAGWINLLLLSSSGPIKIPVGACATALQSMEIACDTLLSGKAKVMLAGGFDDLSEEGSYEFANMKATSNSETEFAMGREPTEMSRPATTTRSGFMESQGSGVHVLMSAKTALELGCPVRGIVAFTSTSTDKAGRSVPAPGRGALSIAREVPSKHPLPVLDLAYRSRQLAFRRTQISHWLANEQHQLQEEVEYHKSRGETVDEEYFACRVADIEQEAARQEKDALATYGMLQGTDPRVAPLRRALAVWGLTADDIGVLSIHGTSTGANEKNETHIWNDVFTTIHRTPGNAVPIMAQKSLCGHSKGGSAAWQLAGLLQSVESGIIPGNRNADNVDANFKKYTYLVFPSKTIHTDGVRAGVMSSFGFGQVGGTCLIVNARYLLGALEPSVYESYRTKNLVRARQCYKAMSEMMISNCLVKVKEAPPYSKELEAPVLLNPLARTTFDRKTGSYSFPTKLAVKHQYDVTNVQSRLRNLLCEGIYCRLSDECLAELISSVPSWNPTFVERNFTDAEIEKGSGIQVARVSSKGAAAPMKDIEILPDESGVPTVILHGDAKSAAEAKGVSKVHLSLSHSECGIIGYHVSHTHSTCHSHSLLGVVWVFRSFIPEFDLFAAVSSLPLSWPLAVHPDLEKTQDAYDESDVMQQPLEAFDFTDLMRIHLWLWLVQRPARDLPNALEVLQMAGVVNEHGDWTGDVDFFVQTGDIIDRGDDTIKLYIWMDKLRDQACAGGTVRLEIRPPSEIQTFGSAASRQKMLMTGQIGRSWAVNYTTAGRLPLHPSLGEPNTDYDTALDSSPLSHAALSFVHGGLAPSYPDLTPFPSRINDLASSLLYKLQHRTPPLPHPPHPYPGLPADATLAEQRLYETDGPLWYRGWALEPEERVCAEVDAVLEKTGTRRMIMGHTPDFQRIVSRCHGKIIIIDTGISHAYGGALSALSVTYTLTPIPSNDSAPQTWKEREVVSALYVDRHDVLAADEREIVGDFSM
ncbi:Fatty acid synthase subunit alpha [Grifola frondosa]|uniref:Fatty acid synthase subunit alpha n=1 Tax=Grifola frondosa TaxID=5627 RepID=A0A1C7M8D1_GRIFR|nr:Fatty acid synthase subunit alpha [Grifola frondosa]